MDVTAPDLLSEDTPEEPAAALAQDAQDTKDADDAEDAEDAEALTLIPYRTRRKRWLRRLAKAVAVVFVASTFLSTAYNAATDGRASVPAGLTYVRAGDVSTRYREWGVSGTPIVLVHGFVESADTWQYLGPLLAAQGHRVYALDIDGWGYSQRVAPFDVGHQARQLEAFMQALHLDKPVLVGHSSGAAVAALAVLDEPAAVGGIMFLDGDGLATGAGQKTPLTHLFLNPYRTTLMRLAIRSDTVIRSIYGATCGAGCPELDAAGVDQWRRPLQVAGAEEALWSMVNLGVAGLPPARLAELATLPMPKAVVFGGADSSYTPDSPQTTAARIGAPAPTVIPGARHLTSVNSPAAVAEAVAELVTRAGGQGTVGEGIGIDSVLRDSETDPGPPEHPQAFGIPRPDRRRIRLITSAVHPVWCEAPRPAPVSPWKYSWKGMRSCQAGSCWNSFTSPNTGRRPSASFRNSDTRRCGEVVGDLAEGRLGRAVAAGRDTGCASRSPKKRGGGRGRR